MNPRVHTSCCILACWLVFSCQNGSNDAADVLRWASARDVETKGATTLLLPSELAGKSRDGKVEIAAFPGGRRCILLRTKLHDKDNFEGWLACNAPLSAHEIQSGGGKGPAYVTLAGYGIFEELYLRRRVDDRTFEVYFDLN